MPLMGILKMFTHLDRKDYIEIEQKVKNGTLAELPPFNVPIPVDKNFHPIHINNNSNTVSSITKESIGSIEVYDYISGLGKIDTCGILDSYNITLLVYATDPYLTPKHLSLWDSGSKILETMECCYVIAIPSNEEIFKLASQDKPTCVPFYRFIRKNIMPFANYTHFPLINSLATILTLSGKDIYTFKRNSLCPPYNNIKINQNRLLFKPSSPIKNHYVFSSIKNDQWECENSMNAIKLVFQYMNILIDKEYHAQNMWLKEKSKYDEKARYIKHIKSKQEKSNLNPCEEIYVPWCSKKEYIVIDEFSKIKSTS